MFRSPFIPKISAVIAGVLASLILLFCEQARADQPCGRDKYQYVEKVATGINIFSTKVTRTDIFTVNEEHPGDTMETLVISFVD